MLLKSTSRLFVVHPTLSLPDLGTDQARIAATVRQADFDRSILDQIDESYDLLILDWELETPDARGVLDAFRQRAPNTQILALADDVPTDDPVDRGADELLVRPLSDEVLQSTIERLLLQQAYETAMDEFFRLSTERALLESELQSGLDVGDRYQSVVSELYNSRARAAAIRDKLSSDEFDQALRQLLE
ncbi:response regulator transcription factor [Haloterrigena sp. SYSU A558-1]|uniref:Response regulator transcription factor n=1 Tax=Haloterrigena gelatinilytica TaxID=2741724 RepID=A0A8J8KDS6_9EURY|nr:response regulator transcription factor [Haloterrigena gelatinilytica]NUB90493.1 response regulator transcription factor [Haloterrigena gelatinilytica]NUC73695.1 response regulator transcription factor [Haloterrigena gelatinilytica]